MTPEEYDDLVKALVFIRDLADEEHAFTKPGSGAEVALRHIKRKAIETLKRFRYAGC